MGSARETEYKVRFGDPLVEVWASSFECFVLAVIPEKTTGRHSKKRSKTRLERF
jgi:hypothetical protein